MSVEDTDHLHRCPFDELLRRHRQARIAVAEAVRNDRDPELVARLREYERRHRRERVRRAMNRRP